MAQSSKDNNNLPSKDCLKALFGEARKKNCFFKRRENKHGKILNTFVTDIINLLHKRDNRFLPRFELSCLSKNTFEIFHEITLGEINPSIYIFRKSKTLFNVCAEAETKKLWQESLEEVDDLSFFNINSLRLTLYKNLSKVLQAYGGKEVWKEHKQCLGLDSIELRDATKMTMILSSFNNQKLKRIVMFWVPTIVVPKYCQPFVRNWFGENIPHLVAKQSRLVAGDPCFTWVASYHKHENKAMKTFPVKISLEAFYGCFVFMQHDEVLKLITRDLMTHVFLELTNHICRWLDINYQDGQEMSERDNGSMMEFFFRSLLQRLEVDFLPNYFNPEIDLLRMSGLSSQDISSIVHRLKVIFRGSCECCRRTVYNKMFPNVSGNDKHKQK